MSQLQVTGEAKIRDIQGPVVANSGVITALNGAANQYVRGDGTLASFPTSGGGGSSVSYYLNGSVNQGTFGGSTYYQMSKNAIVGSGTNFSTSANGLIAQFITDANDPDVVSIPSGNWNVEFFMSVSASSGSLASFYVEIYKYDGSTFTLLATNVATPEQLTNTTTVDAYFTSVAMPLSSMAVTDRLAIRVFANVASKTVTLYTEDNRLCQVVTTFSKGMLSMNNLTDQSQYLTTGTAGTNFAIASTGDTHTFNLPVASATNTGKLSSTDWSTFNNKQNTITDPITGTGVSTGVAYFNSGTSITSEAAFNYDASTNRLGVNTSVPNATIGANAATDSGYSLLLKNDNANYNGIGFATTSTYGNVIGTEKLGTAPARNLTLLNQSGYISLTEVGNLGVGILTPNTGIDIYNGTTSSLWLHTANSGVTGTDGVRLALFSNNGAVLRNNEGTLSMSSEGDFYVITLGAENIRVNSVDGKVGIGNPATVAEMLTVNGSIQQSGVLSSLLKTNGDGKLIAAVAGTDYVVPSALSGYVPTSRTITINGTTQDLSANISYSVGTMGGSGVAGRVAYYNGTNSITSEAAFNYDDNLNRFGVNTNSPNATIGANSPTDSNYSLLLKNSDTNYSGIGFATSSVYGNTIETVRIGSAPSRNLTLYNYAGYISLTEAGNLGVGILTPNTGIDIYHSTISSLWLHTAASGTSGTDGVRLFLSSNSNAVLRNNEGSLSMSSESDFFVITLGAENIRVNSANGFVGIGNPTTLTSILTVNGAITQTSVTSALLKTNASGTLVAAVAGTDYLAGSVISGTTDYIPRFTSSTTIGNSDISQDATFVILNSKALSAPRARFNTAYDNASLTLNVAGQTYMDSRTSRLYNTFNLSSMTNYMHIYDPYSTINANGGFSIGASTSITLLPSTSIIHFDGVNNRVGVGTTAPTRTFSVTGTSYFNGTFTLAGGAGFNYDSLRFAYSNGTSSNNIYSGGADGLNISNQADTEILMRVTNSGNVGIGTINPDVTGFGWNTLTIRGGTTSGEAGVLELQTVTTNTNGQNIGIMAFMDGSSRNAQISVQRATSTSTSNLLFYTNGGAGIVERLKISSTGASTFSGDIFYNNGGNQNLVITSGAPNNGRMYIYSAGNADIGFQAGGSSWFTNSLGIGTDSPSGLLHVQGALTSGLFNIRSLDSASMAANVGGGIGFGGKYTTAGVYTDFGFIKGMKNNATSDDYGGYISFLTRPNGGSFGERLRITSDGRLSIKRGGGTVNFDVFQSGGGDNFCDVDGEVFRTKALLPLADNAYNIGSSGSRWTAVWAVNGSIQTSDEREKKDIVNTDLGLDFVTKLRPVSFKWKVGQNIVTTETIIDEEGNETEKQIVTPREGKRTHYGLIAQEVEALLDGKDFGGFISDEETGLKGLRYDQFVPLLIKSIQELEARIKQLENK